MILSKVLRLNTFSVVLVCALALLFTGCATSVPDAGAFRVMSYNIHHGEGMDGRIDINRIAELIKAENADIVALQEVDRGVLRSGRRDLTEELAKLTGMSCFFSNNIHYQGGEYGNAVLTRFPILHMTNVHYKMLQPDEQRGVIQMVMMVKGKRVLFLNTHLDYRDNNEAERLLHVATMKQMTNGFGNIPVIICGDFNSTPDSDTHKEMEKFTRDSWELAGSGEGLTIPPDRPVKRIDYIWVSDGVKPLSVWVPATQASDHLPVMGEFRLSK